MLTLFHAYGQLRMGSIFHENLALGGLPPDWTIPPRSTRLAGLPPAVATLSNDQLLDLLRERPEVYYIRTHKLNQASTSDAAIHIVRDGRDSIVSHAHFVGGRDVPRFRGLSLQQRMAKLIWPGIKSYGHWSRSVEAWCERDAPTPILRFEELLTDPLGAIRVACEAIGIELPIPTGGLPEFANLHEQNPVMYRKGQTGAWQTEIPSPCRRVSSESMRTECESSVIDRLAAESPGAPGR